MKSPIQEPALARRFLQFTMAQELRLAEKEQLGFTGWEDPRYRVSIMGRLKMKVDDLNSGISAAPQKDLVDVANFAMMLWGLIEGRKETMK